MRVFIIFIFAFIFCSCSQNLSVNKEKEIENLNLFMDNWHHAAAVADEDLFFGNLDSMAVYLGTDPSERWTKSEFMDWGMKYFERDTAWAFIPYNRVWEFTDDMNYAWFDELLETHMGICRGSGVLQKHENGWKIKHYNLALTLANEKMNDYRLLIK